jgi:hypothetical protein
MDFVTHMATGALVAQSVCPPEHRWAFALVGAGAAVVPDIDFVARLGKNDLSFLKNHRGLTHSLLAIPIIATAAAASGNLLFDAPFWPLAATCVLAAFSHLVLDVTTHASGIAWLWPHRKRLTWSLFIGLNPLTSSARCSERRVGTCVRCSMHSAILNPFVALVLAGFLASLAAPSWALASRISLGVAALYLGAVGWIRWRASRLLRKSLGDDGAGGAIEVLRAFPAGFSPMRWLGLVGTDRGVRLFDVNALTGRVEPRSDMPPSEDSPVVQATLDTATVREFLGQAMHPYARSYAVAGGSVVIWRDLALAFSPVVSLYTARVVLDGQRRVVAERFLERWAVPPDTRTLAP